MFEQKLNAFSQLPVQEKERKCTDVICTIISAIFALVMFILAFVLMNKDNYYKTNYPTDSDKEPCAYGKNEGYSYIFFPEPSDTQTRVCVSTCPTASTQQVICRPNSKIPDCVYIQPYESVVDLGRLGGFCSPTNEALRSQILENINVSNKYNFLNRYDIIRIALLVSLALGLLWMVLVQLCPRYMAGTAIGIGSLVLLVSGILLLADNATGWGDAGIWRILIAIFCIFFAILFFVMLFLYRRRIKIAGVLLHYAAKFLGERPVNFIYIPIFLLLTIGLIILCFFQYLAYSSNSDPEPRDDDIYLHTRPNPILTILNIIEFIWGMQFLKDSFNFILSGNASEWYVTNGEQNHCMNPVKRLLCKNWGSVAGGSFLNAFFNFFDFLYETFRCYPEGCCGKCAPLCTKISKLCCCNCYDLVRNDAYSYINLTGIPYCNSARNCQSLCNNSKLFIGNQSVMFFYRLCAHAFCVGLTTLLAYWMMKSRIEGIHVGSLIATLILVYCVVTYFIDIHADSAQALQIAYLTELELSGGNPENLSTDYQGLKGELRAMDRSYQDGKC